MNRSKMLIIVALMCSAIAAVVVLQRNWLVNSYAVSKEKNEAEIKTLLNLAIAKQKQNAADSVRYLIKQIVRSDKDFKYRIIHGTKGTDIGFAGSNTNMYALYALSDDEMLSLEKEPYDFLIKKMNKLQLDELYPLYNTLIGTTYYDDESPEKLLQLRLASKFNLFSNTEDLKRILEKLFSAQGRSFSGSVRYFKDISIVYSGPTKVKLVPQRLPNPSNDAIAVFPGTDNSRSLAVKLDLLEVFTDSLNRLSDSIFVGKPLLYDLNNILSEQVPTILLSTRTPHTFIGQKMSAGISGSFALMVFITLCVIYMYITIVKQKQLSEIKNDFISNISHELKTPIATVQAAIQGLRFFDLQQNPSKTKSYLNTAYTEIQRLSLMVDEILNISLFENSAFDLSPEHFNFKLMLTQIIDSQEIRKEKPIKISLLYDAQQEIFADKIHIHNVMVSLIDNAIKYSGSKVHVAINCKTYLDGLEVSISDDGHGIPVKFRDYIFDKFFRVPDNGHSVKGFGLGLNYIKTIIEKHRGSIKLSDASYNGSVFIIKLPQ